MFIRLLAFSLLAISSFAHAAEKFRITHPSADVVYFDGAIHEQSVAQLLAAFTPQTRSLLITSQGGEMSSAIHLAREIHGRKLSVIVKDYCLSACSNYVFLAGETKILLSRSFLGYHGSAIGGLSAQEIQNLENREASDKPITDFPDFVHGMALQELQFAREVGVSPELYRATKDVVDSYIRSHHLPTPPVRTWAKVTTPAGTRRLSIAQLDAMMKKQGNKKKDIKFEAHIVLENPAAALGFFPRRDMLERHGVSGIVQYDYPASADELQQLGASKFKGATFFGEFDK